MLDRARSPAITGISSPVESPDTGRDLPSLRRACASFLDHYHTERAHQGIGNERIEARTPGHGKVQCHERLGGIFKQYRAAA